jgi:very-short-patch-repair endonuclease
MSMPERKLWNRIKDRRLRGLKFRRQHPIGAYTADFFCAEAKLLVELDSSWHNSRQEEDAQRDRYMVSLGFETLRIRARSLEVNMPWVLDRIATVALARIAMLKAEEPLTGSA